MSEIKPSGIERCVAVSVAALAAGARKEVVPEAQRPRPPARTARRLVPPLKVGNFFVGSFVGLCAKIYLPASHRRINARPGHRSARFTPPKVSSLQQISGSPPVSVLRAEV